LLLPTGTYLAHYPDNDRFIGRTMPQRSRGQADPLDTADIADLDGVERIVAYSTLPVDAGGLVVINSAEALARYGALDEFPIVNEPMARADLARHLASVLGGA
jgi:hypothetical protein